MAKALKCIMCGTEGHNSHNCPRLQRDITQRPPVKLPDKVISPRPHEQAVISPLDCPECAAKDAEIARLQGLLTDKKQVHAQRQRAYRERHGNTS